MAEKSFMIKTDDVTKSIKTIDEKKQRFQEECKRLYDEVNALTTVWEGATAKAFNSELSQYSETINEMAKLLSTFTTNVGNAIRLYEEADKNLADKAKIVRR